MRGRFLSFIFHFFHFFIFSFFHCSIFSCFFHFFILLFFFSLFFRLFFIFPFLFFLPFSSFVFYFFSFFHFFQKIVFSNKNHNFKARFWVREEERRQKNAPTETGPFHNRTQRTFLLLACVETPHSDSRWQNDQAGREQRSVHNGHVVLSRQQVQLSSVRDTEWPNRFRQACKIRSIVWRWKIRHQSF